MDGSMLIPLNQMQSSHPELRDKYLEKYKGREEILKRKIPLLDCLWNDVVQFLPLNPRKVFELQAKLGIIPKVPPYKFFQIELSLLDPAKTVVFFKDAIGEENVTVKWLSDVDFAALQEIPPATIRYYKSLIGTDELPFNFQFIPHILHLGSVDVASAEIIAINK